METIRAGQDLQRASHEVPGSANASEGLREPINALSPYGGFALFESAIDGAASLNPDHGARNAIFLTDARKKAERDALLQTLTQWAEVLELSDSAGICDYCDSQA